jgi:[protein-PII] uridylyltransferase
MRSAREGGKQDDEAGGCALVTAVSASDPLASGASLTSFAAERARRTADTDRWLTSLLGAEPGLALVAVGGYGRRELLPGSDLDVLLLHDCRDGIAAVADRIWYPIWDAGVRLDHAVRTPAEARRTARADLRVALGLLNARHVAGAPELTSALRLGALEDWRRNSRTRLADLRAMCAQRAERHGELAFLLEPDLKEARATCTPSRPWPLPGWRRDPAHGCGQPTRR